MVTFNDMRSLRATYSTKFSYPAAPHFLTFQLSMDGDCPSVFWQAIFSVHVHGQERVRMIRLTSRGNTETVELRGNDGDVSIVPGDAALGSLPTCGGEGAAGVITPCAYIDFGMKSIEVRITMPLALLQTWIALAAGDELLGPERQKSARTAIERLLIPALSVESDGRKYVAQVKSVAFLSIDENEIDPRAEDKACSLLTGRLVTRLHIETSNVLEQADLQWNLFNGAVFSATAVISGNGPTVLHEFSTYQPNYHWQRGL